MRINQNLLSQVANPPQVRGIDPVAMQQNRNVLRQQPMGLEQLEMQMEQQRSDIAKKAEIEAIMARSTGEDVVQNLMQAGHGDQALKFGQMQNAQRKNELTATSLDIQAAKQRAEQSRLAMNDEQRQKLSMLIDLYVDSQEGVDENTKALMKEMFLNNPEELQKRLFPDHPKYGLNPVYGTANGRTALGQVGSDGTFHVIDTGDFQPTGGVTKVDTGTSTALVDKSGQQVGDIHKNLFEAESEKVEGREAGERKANKIKEKAKLDSLEIGWKTVERSIQQAKEVIEENYGVTGIVGSQMAKVPGTDAYILARLLDTIKANIGFDKLQNMRDNSPTGGALGQVSEFENKLLQAVQGSLDQGLDSTALSNNLDQIFENLQGFRASVQRGFESTYPEERTVDQQVTDMLDSLSQDEQEELKRLRAGQ